MTGQTEITPKLVRAARALLAWSQQDLAKTAGVATSTVADFERGHRKPVANNAQAIRNALEEAGIQFLPTGAVIGPTVRVPTTTTKTGAPIRWISAEDLSDWANRMDGAASLPTLIAHLIRATHGSEIHLRFPSDEGIRHAGWDGLTFKSSGSTYVPPGNAGWEIGAQRSKILDKARDDYEKRTDNPTPLDPTKDAFIFVTPRHWPGKDKWVKDRLAEGRWRDVRAYDADDLVHWIEQSPAVGAWLAKRLSKRPSGIRELDEIWEEWSFATKWPLTQDLVLSDRDEDAVEVLRWLRAKPSVLSLRAASTDEVAAFFHATLDELPGDLARAYRARCLVATNSAAARSVAQASMPLILLMTQPEPGLAMSLASKGHHVIQAYDERPTTQGEVRTLSRPSRESIKHALIDSGIAEARAKALARDSARNLAILRRLIPAAPGSLPSWAEPPPTPSLLIALLVGAWDEDSEGDCALISSLADQAYEKVAAELTSYLGKIDSPLQKVGATWRITSPQDAWMLLAQYLSSINVERFEKAAYTVLGSADPRFELAPEDRWFAPAEGIHPEYSAYLRHGIGQTLILFALWHEQVKAAPNASRLADAVVSKLLSDADERRWWSLSNEFRLLAESSPKAFLDAIDDSLDQNAPSIRALFGADSAPVIATEHLSDLMWALEALAWSPDLLPRVSHTLARLDAIDTQPRQYANGPANSLRDSLALVAANLRYYGPTLSRTRSGSQI